MTEAEKNKASTTRKWGRRLAFLIPRLLVGLGLLYLFGLIIYDGPAVAFSLGNWLLAGAWLGLAIYSWIHFRQLRFLKRVGVLAGLAVLVLIPWSFISASNDREWKPEFAQTGWVEQKSDVVTFHNYRDFIYHDDGSIEERWLTKTFRLSNLQGVDLFHDAFGGDLVAHPILSFDFGEEGRVVLSIETRREKGESFSIFGGLYKMFELQYLFGSERDFVGVRTRIRKEPVFHYHLHSDPEIARKLLLDSIQAQNELKSQPRFYNVITANCTTSLRAQSHQKKMPLDYRMLLNGRFDELLHENGVIAPDENDFEEVRKNAYLNPRAEAADWSTEEGFSEGIRN